MAKPRYAAVELGGMSIRLAIAEGSVDNIVERTVLITETPEVTLPKIVAWLREQQPFVSLGIASFGPIDPRKGSPTYGYITTTPKVSWRNFNLLEALDVFGVPTGFDTDVNAPAVFEFNHAVESGDSAISSCAYITVGTGVGIAMCGLKFQTADPEVSVNHLGLVVNGKPVHGLLHPEGGHMPYPKRLDDEFGGMEGWNIPQGIEANTCALALQKRANLDSPDGLKDLPDSHPVWTHAAHFLAGACVNLILIASPERIVIGGGVLNRKCLFPMIRAEVQRVLNGYVQVDSIVTDKIDSYIVPAVYENDAGIIGALALAQSTLERGGGAHDSLVRHRPQMMTSYVTGAVVGVLATLAIQRMLSKL